MEDLLILAEFGNEGRGLQMFPVSAGHAIRAPTRDAFDMLDDVEDVDLAARVCTYLLQSFPIAFSASGSTEALEADASRLSAEFASGRAPFNVVTEDGGECRARALLGTDDVEAIDVHSISLFTSNQKTGKLEFTPLCETVGIQPLKHLLLQLEKHVGRASYDVWSPDHKDVLDKCTERFKEYHEAMMGKLQGKDEALYEIMMRSSRDFQKMYNVMREKLLKEEQGGYKQLCGELRNLIEPGQNKPRQANIHLADVYSSAKIAHGMYRALIAHLTVGTRIQIPDIPPLKHLLRCIEKMAGSSWKADGICDIVRCMIVCQSFQQHAHILARLGSAPVTVTRIKNRYENPSSGGWADLMINFVFKSDPHKHVCELQVVHHKLLALRKGGGGHGDYNRSRCSAELLELMLGEPTFLEALKNPFLLKQHGTPDEAHELVSPLASRSVILAQTPAKTPSLLSQKQCAPGLLNEGEKCERPNFQSYPNLSEVDLEGSFQI